MRLIDADRLKKVFDTVDPSGAFALCSTILDKIDEQPTVPQYGQWFKVEDKLPEKNKPVLVIVNGRDWDEPVQYLDIDCLTEDGLWNAHHLGVSYWMPLPEPPKDNEKVKSNALESN